MEEYLYIILGIIWLVVSLLGNKKKKQAQQTQQPQQRTRPVPSTNRETTENSQPIPRKEKDFEVLFEEFFGTEKQQPEVQQSPQPAAQPLPESETSYYDERWERDKEEVKFPQHVMSQYENLESLEEDYQFSAEGKIATIEDLIKSYDSADEKDLLEDSDLTLVDLNNENQKQQDFEFDARKAIVYSEIINRKYF